LKVKISYGEFPSAYMQHSPSWHDNVLRKPPPFFLRKAMVHSRVKSSPPLVTHPRADESPFRPILFRIHTILTTNFPQLASNAWNPWLLLQNVLHTSNRIVVAVAFPASSTYANQLHQLLHQQHHKPAPLQQQFLWFQNLLTPRLLTPLFLGMPSCCLVIALPRLVGTHGLVLFCAHDHQPTKLWRQQITDVTSRGKQCRQWIPAIRKSHYRNQRTE